MGNAIKQVRTQTTALILFTLSSFLSSFLFTGGTDTHYLPALCFCIIALIFTWSKGQKIEIPLHSFIYGLFILHAGSSFFWSGAPYISLVTWLILCMAPLSYLLGRVTLKTYPKRAYALISAFIGFGIFMCFYGIWDFYVGSAHRKSSIFSNPNTFSAFLVLCLIPCGTFLFQESKHKHHAPLLWGGLCALFIACIIMTGSRSGLITAVFALTAVVLLTRNTGKMRYALWLVGIFLGIMATSYISNSWFAIRVVDTLSTSINNSFHGRFTIWAGSWDLAQAHFFYGTGLGTFFLEYPPYRHAYDPSVGDWVHMDGLQIWAETGLFGVILWYGFWASLAVSLMKKHKNTNAYTIIGGIGCLALGMQSHMTYLYTVMPIIFAFGVFLSIYDHDTHLNKSEATPLSVSKTWATAFTLFIAFLTLQSALSMHLTQKAQDNILRVRTDEAKRTLHLIDNYGSPSFYEHHLVNARHGDFKSLQRTMELCKPCAQPHYIEALNYIQSGDIVQAKQSLWNALKRDPSDQDIRLQFVRLLDQENRRGEAVIIAKLGFSYPITQVQKVYLLEIISKFEKKK